MPLLYRAMIEDENDGRPLLVPTARGLGIRRGVDIAIDEFGDVEPGEGISVAYDTPENLPDHRRPPEAGGTGKDPVWVIDSDELPDALAYREDDELPGHGFIEPSGTMPLEEYEAALAETRDVWRKYP